MLIGRHQLLQATLEIKKALANRPDLLLSSQQFYEQYRCVGEWKGVAHQPPSCFHTCWSQLEKNLCWNAFPPGLPRPCENWAFEGSS